jgi:membrane protease YdiL (CAAX protease family)
MISLVVAHSIIGVPLSLAWRRTGNMAVPGFAHALIDAGRDGLRAAA